MTARQGIDFTVGWWRGLEDKVFKALQKCELCANKKACRDWLAADGGRASYIAFCPNAGLIETCRILDRGTSRPNIEPFEAFSCEEPSLAEILAEPIIQLVMASDQVSSDGGQERPAAPRG
jgi:hypothetical protein